METTKKAFTELSTEVEEFTELSVNNPCVIDDIVKELKEVIEPEEEEMIFKPPRFFRDSIIKKTFKLFGVNCKDKVKKPKAKHPIRQK